MSGLSALTNAQLDDIAAYIVNPAPPAQTPTAFFTLSSLTFPSTVVGVTSAVMTTTLTNTGAGTLNISSFSIGSGNAATDFNSSTSTCTGSMALSPGSSCAFKITFTPKAAGTRTATLYVNHNAGATLDTIALSGPATSAAALAQTGWWWNPGEGGRGFSIEQKGDKIFMASYLYDTSGRATWYGIGPTTISGSGISSTLSAYASGQTITGAYKAPTGPVSSGNFSVAFTDASHGTITWPGGTIPIERYSFVTNGAGSTNPAGTPESGWWWSATEGGRGYSIEIQNGTMFMAGYMYDASGNPIWYASGPSPMASTTTYSGSWQQYGNGQTLTGAYKSAGIVNANVGTISVVFSSTTAGTLTLPDGRQIAITRYAF